MPLAPPRKTKAPSSWPPQDGVTVLVVDDEPGLRSVLEIALKRGGYRAVVTSGRAAALAEIAKNPPFPIIISDLVMPDGSGMDVLLAAREKSDQTQVIIVTAFSTVESALEAMRLGAYDFVTKPFSTVELLALVAKAIEKNSLVSENRRLKRQLASAAPDPADLFAHCEVMRKVGVLVQKAASTRTTVLITGETGTGKERIARALHRLSDRASGPFCVINCAALPEALMESELFGHERGAFTGATTTTLGLFRQADGGTLLLDEIGELPLSLQVKLLRVLQEKKVRSVGGTTETSIDVRMLAATNRDIEFDVAAGTFRTDLYYRLNVIRVALPPLRDRTGEARRLAQQMLVRFSAELKKDLRGITPLALRALENHDFPGNVRELENMIERAVALSSGEWIDVDLLPEAVTSRSTPDLPPTITLPDAGCDLDAVLQELERHLITQALERTGGVRMSAAKVLGISFRSFRYRLAKLGLAAPDSDTDGTDMVDSDAAAITSKAPEASAGPTTGADTAATVEDVR
ncbi:MAG: sigma-54-dependent Fis family transcriptional regulator [Myxococcales bacterium]|nr:sigma-54-dependent Fis family transcriptional regulator [Myxococcales bacterium]